MAWYLGTNGRFGPEQPDGSFGAPRSPAWYGEVWAIRQLSDFYHCSFFEMQDRLNRGEDHLWYWWSISTEAEREGRAIREQLTI